MFRFKTDFSYIKRPLNLAVNPHLLYTLLAVCALLGRSKFQIINTVLVGLIKTNKNKMDNLSKSYDAGINVPSQLPDMRIILESLQKEAQFQNELVSKSYNIANTVKKFQPLISDREMDKQKEPDCLVEFLWEVVGRFQKQNREIDQSLQHLASVIGV